MNNFEIQIILIDYDIITNFINQQIIKNFGISRLKAFTSTTRALDFIKINSTYSTYIFINIHMPIIDGFEFIDELKKNDIKTNVYFTSNTINPEHFLKAKEQKIKILNKPLTELVIKELLCE